MPTDLPDLTAAREALAYLDALAIGNVGAVGSYHLRAALAVVDALTAERDRFRNILAALNCPCPDCGGTGTVGDHYMRMRYDGEPEEVDERSPCQACEGTGNVLAATLAAREVPDAG